MTGVSRGTAERRQRSEAGRKVGSRSALVVPMKRGNRPEGPRGGKGGAGDTELLEGKTTEPPTSDTVSTRLQRIAGAPRAARPLGRAHGDGRGLGPGSGHQEFFRHDFALPASRD